MSFCHVLSLANLYMLLVSNLMRASHGKSGLKKRGIFLCAPLRSLSLLWLKKEKKSPRLGG